VPEVRRRIPSATSQRFHVSDIEEILIPSRGTETAAGLEADDFKRSVSDFLEGTGAAGNLPLPVSLAMRSRVCVVEKAYARETGGEKLRHGSVLSRRGNMAKVTVTKQKPTHLQIANRAFEIYVSRGGDHGHDVGDWFEAERQLQTEIQPKKQAVKQT
jgi:Protein of unknown function (DUF2934)